MTHIGKLTKEEEEIITRKKLLYDGHGTGEDKRLLSIIKNITKFCSPKHYNEDNLNPIIKDLSNAIAAAMKHEKLFPIAEQTHIILEESIKRKQKNIYDLELEMLSIKDEMEFIAKLKQVNLQPDCQTTQKTIEDVINYKQTLLSRIEKQNADLETIKEACTKLKIIADDTTTSMEIDYNKMDAI